MPGDEPDPGSGTDARAGLAGRRLYFVGIGGSGLSAYANIARALGADVRGWDVRDTIFMATSKGSTSISAASRHRPGARR